MKNNLKKALALLLASALLLGALSMGASAEGTPTGTEAASFGVTLSSTDVAPGDVVTVTVTASANYNACTLRIPVIYDEAFFTLNSAVNAGRVAIGTPIDTVTACAGRSSASNVDTGLPAAYASQADAYGVVLCQWFAAAQNNTLGVFNTNGASADAFTFELKVKDDAQGSGNVFVALAPDLFYNDAVNDPSDMGTIYKATGIAFSVADAATATIAVAAEPELVAAEGYNVQIKQFTDDDTKYLIGFDADAIVNDGADFTEQFVVTNGTYQVSDTLFQTGVTVTVYDLNGVEFETYTVIFFGDTYADGFVDNFDADEIWAMFNYSRDFENAFLYAADLMVDDPDSVDQSTTDNYDADEIWAMYNALKPLNDYQLHQ